MPRPTRPQWCIIWIAVLVASHFRLNLRLADLWTSNYRGAWGVPGYLDPAYTYQTSKFALVVLVVAGLLLWQAGGKSGGAKANKQ